MTGVAIAIAAWLGLSFPVALLLARFVAAQHEPVETDDREPAVIADAARCPLPPHLRQSEAVADLG